MAEHGLKPRFALQQPCKNAHANARPRLWTTRTPRTRRRARAHVFARNDVAGRMDDSSAARIQYVNNLEEKKSATSRTAIRRPGRRCPTSAATCSRLWVAAISVERGLPKAYH